MLFEVEPAAPKANEVVGAVAAWATQKDILLSSRYKAWLGREVKRALETYPAEVVGPAASVIVAKGLNPSLLDSECVRVQASHKEILSWEETRELLRATRDRSAQETLWWRRNASFFAKRVMQEVLRMRASGAPHEDLVGFIRDKSIGGACGG